MSIPQLLDLAAREPLFNLAADEEDVSDASPCSTQQLRVATKKFLNVMLGLNLIKLVGVAKNGPDALDEPADPVLSWCGPPINYEPPQLLANMGKRLTVSPSFPRLQLPQLRLSTLPPLCSHTGGPLQPIGGAATALRTTPPLLNVHLRFAASTPVPESPGAQPQPWCALAPSHCRAASPIPQMYSYRCQVFKHTPRRD